MTRKSKRVGRTRAEIHGYWAGVIRRYLQRPGGMTRAEFVEREGVTFPSFRRWLQKLRNEVSPIDVFAEVQIADQPAGEVGESRERCDSIGWHEIAKQPCIEVRLPRGTVVRFYDSSQTDALLAMVEVTEGRAC